MTKDEKLDEFLKRIGIELLPFQKELIGRIYSSIRSIRRFGRTLYSDIQKGSLDRRYCLR